MNDLDVSRRSFIKRSVAMFSAFPLVTHATAESSQETLTPDGYVKLIWLTPPSTLSTGVTCGVCWPRGKVKKQSDFTALDSSEQAIQIQSWPLAYWPDGSLKW